MRRIFALPLVLGLLSVPAVLGQESPNFKLKAHVFNAAGHPAGGSILTSTSFRITLDAIGGSVTPASLDSSSYQIDAGFVLQFRKPREATGLPFSDKQTMTWDDAEQSVRPTYNLYRAVISSLGTLAYGACLEEHITDPTTMDPGVPMAGEGHFYLATAENCVGLEGTKGFQSNGTQREGTVCP